MDFSDSLFKLSLVQQKLNEISDETYEETKDFILNSKYTKAPQQIEYLTHELFQAFMARPKHEHLLTKLVADIIQSELSESFTSLFRVSFVLESITGGDEFFNNSNVIAFHFIRQCILSGDSIKVEDLYSPIESILLNSKKNCNTSSLLFFFFGDLLQDENPLLYIKLVKATPEDSVTFMPYFSLKRSLINEYVNYGHLLRSIENCLSNDDVDSLINLSTAPDFNFSAKLMHLTFEPYGMLQGNPSLIQYAAFFGSIKCFKYLLLNGACTTDKDIWSQPLTDFAVAGGNLEIVRILNQENIPIDSLEATIEMKQYEIFDWIIQQYQMEDVDITPKLNECMQYSTRYNDAVTLIKCLNMGVPLTLVAGNGWGILHFAILYRNTELCEILANSPEIDVNQKDLNGSAPLSFAVANNCFGIVKVLSQNKRININEIENKNWTCLHQAVSAKDTRIIEYLIQIPGLNVNAVDDKKRTALALAKELQYTQGIQILEKCPRVTK